MMRKYGGDFSCRFFIFIQSEYLINFQLKLKKIRFFKKTIYNELLNEYVSLINIIIIFNIL
jgi:hypothetical protein